MTVRIAVNRLEFRGGVMVGKVAGSGTILVRTVIAKICKENVGFSILNYLFEKLSPHVRRLSRYSWTEKKVNVY